MYMNVIIGLTNSTQTQSIYIPNLNSTSYLTVVLYIWYTWPNGCYAHDYYFPKTRDIPQALGNYIQWEVPPQRLIASYVYAYATKHNHCVHQMKQI